MQNHTNTKFNFKQAKRAAAAIAISTLLVATDASAAPRVPAGNLTDNPSFQAGTKHWSSMASKVSRKKQRHAPHGRSVALVKAFGAPETYTIDDAPATVTSQMSEAGATYKASAFVRAGKRTRGKTVGIVLRETTADGAWVADSEGTIKLTKRFRRVETDLTASADGNQVDVYIRRAEAVRKGESFMTDAITLVKVNEEPPTEEPPVEEPPTEEPPAGTDVITTSQVALVTSHESPLFQNDGSKYAYIMIRDSISNRIGDLRRVHPESKILLYKNAAFTVEEAPGCEWAPLQGTGVSYCDADSHENWFLHNKNNGQRLSSSSYVQQRAMDIGNPAYQQAWIDSVTARLRDAKNDGSNQRIDGVWLDDVNLYPGHGMDGQIQGMSDAAYRAAMVEFMDVVGPALENAGFLAVPNLGMDPWDSAQRNAAIEVAGDSYMINREGLVRWGEEGTIWTDPDGAAPHWDDEVELAEDIQAAGAKFHAMTYGTSGDVQVQRYARATFLMAWNGEKGSAFNYRTSNGGDWTADWTTEVGTPTGDRQQVGQGWKRSFTNGVAVINARANGSQSFNLGGQFRQADGSCTSSVTLAAKRALVMPKC